MQKINDELVLTEVSNSTQADQDIRVINPELLQEQEMNFARQMTDKEESFQVFKHEATQKISFLNTRIKDLNKNFTDQTKNVHDLKRTIETHENTINSFENTIKEVTNNYNNLMIMKILAIFYRICITRKTWNVN